MSNAYLWLIPGLPLIAAVVTAFFGKKYLRKNAHWPCIIGVAGSCLLALRVLVSVPGEAPAPAAPEVSTAPTWMQIGNVNVLYELHADGLSAIMLLGITFVGSLIAIFSVGYMSHEREHEEGYYRFFAAVALFIFSMTGLVLANNFIMLYAFWEGVGVCSYMLIGFWYYKPSAAAAARKAFLVTRLGDIGLFLGILLLWAGMNEVHGNGWAALNYSTAFQYAATVVSAQDRDFCAVVALLLFCGAVGKSAQFPLYVWLPDAMEGPTPVSALIHAATMVTAGVYLVARAMPIFHAAPEWVLLLVACIGAFTALLAALIALTQTDLKRVLAYSTISQIGYMFLALGCAVKPGLVLIAVLAAIFHLFTHAFFKALLFLSAGSVMHAMGNVIDMRRFSGLKSVLPTTHWCFLAGAVALAGLPPFSGFWSKDEILAVAVEASHHAYHNTYLLLFVVGLVTAGLTAFYTFRAYFLTFSGEVRIPPEAGHHAHESPPVMTVPLMILAVGAVAAGAIVALSHAFGHILEHAWLPFAFPGRDMKPDSHGMNYTMMLGSSVVAFSGVGLAWFMYAKSPSLADRLANGMQTLYQLSLNKFHVDEVYDALIVRPLAAFAAVCRLIDMYIVDSLVDLVAQTPRLLGSLLRPIQNGLVQFYALTMVLGLAVFLAALVLRMAR